jgi:hypothetical protein
MDAAPIRFIGEPIEVEFDHPPVLIKSPPCPHRFRWRDAMWSVAAVLAEWRDYRRRGKMAHNMREAHLETAAQRGSWGVGRAYFRVRTTEGRLFDLYYDRAADGAGGRAGSWYLFRELGE